MCWKRIRPQCPGGHLKVADGFQPMPHPSVLVPAQPTPDAVRRLRNPVALDFIWNRLALMTSSSMGESKTYRGRLGGTDAKDVNKAE